MSDHLSSTIICPHCGERYRVEVKQNKAGDAVQRGVCPLTPASSPQPLWYTDWQMLRMKRPASALTDEEVLTQQEELDEAMEFARRSSPWQG